MTLNWKFAVFSVHCQANPIDCNYYSDLLCGFDISRDLYMWFNGLCHLNLSNVDREERKKNLNTSSVTFHWLPVKFVSDFVQLPLRYCRKKVGDPGISNTFDDKQLKDELKNKKILDESNNDKAQSGSVQVPAPRNWINSEILKCPMCFACCLMKRNPVATRLDETFNL